ncbi:MAG: hypothetical protein DLM52_05280 [Chthoniobacterales bacterium]|nr:MAG: hypothetical protein DLM52_05280 [Chthoniobacterales bacterium]
MSEEQRDRVSKGAWVAMVLIVLALGFVVFFANWKRAHRDEIETVTVSHFTPTASPSPSASP